MRAFALSLLFVACSNDAPAPHLATRGAAEVITAPAPRAAIPPKACEPLAAADDAKLVHLEGLALGCNDALADANVDLAALEAAIGRDTPVHTDIEVARKGCAAFLAEVARGELTIAGCRKSEQPNHHVNPLLAALRVVGIAAWDHVAAHRYDEAAKLLGRAIRTSVMIGRSDDTSDMMVVSRIGTLLTRLQPLQSKVLPTTREAVRVDLALAVAHLIDPDARIHLALTHAVTLGSAPGDVAAPVFGAAAAEVLAKLEVDPDWRPLHEQAKTAFAATPAPSIKGELATLTPAERDYLARQSKLAVLELIEALDRNLGPVETLLRKTQAAW